MKHLFIVGAQRSGSTYLYQLLDEHPQISMAHPVRPEPKFFLNEQGVAKGPDYYEQTCFADRKTDALYLGEKSTSYIESPEAATRIQRFFPDARILVILRDPVLRAYSNYRFSAANGLETMSFEAALAAEPERLTTARFSSSVSPFAYRQRGHYMDYLDKYLAVFDASQIKVLIFEELVNNLDQVHALYGWLGIDTTHTPPSLSKVVNPAPDGGSDTQIAKVFADLALCYRDSTARLEKFLNREITAWRTHHRQLASTFP
ncbi:MAG: sulfotransferase [Hylemonella sp.]|nr:sulfotransferase [Hylemonella sp.]